MSNGNRTAVFREAVRWPDSRDNFTIIHSVGRSMSKCFSAKQQVEDPKYKIFTYSAIKVVEKVTNSQLSIESEVS